MGDLEEFRVWFESLGLVCNIPDCGMADCLTVAVINAVKELQEKTIHQAKQDHHDMKNAVDCEICTKLASQLASNDQKELLIRAEERERIEKIIDELDMALETMEFNLPLENSPDIFGDQRVRAYKKGYNQVLNNLKTKIKE